MKLILILILCLLNFGCANTEKVNKMPIMIEEMMRNYFGGYDFTYYDISARGNQNGQFYALIEVNKNDLSREKMSYIVVDLKKNGWILKEETSNFYHLCNEDKISLNILFPENLKEYTTNQVPIEFDNINMWNIFINKSTSPIAECVGNSEMIVDFNSL